MESDEGAGLVRADEWVILTDNRNEQRLLKINDHKNFKWRKTPIPLVEVTKHSYYTQLEVGNMKLTPVEWQFGEEEAAAEPQEEHNNRQIFSIDAPQKLTPEQIQRMKKEMTPEGLISELVENNEQFSKRTDYSKQKYMKKKERKYMFRIYAQPVCLQSIHQYHYNNEPQAVGWIRWDMLALMLLTASPLGSTLLAQHSKGLFLAAAISRGAKKITVASSDKKALKQCPIVQQMNLPKEKKQSVQFEVWEQVTSNSAPRFSNLILAGNYDFVELLSSLHHTLINGANIVCYCLSSEPLQKAAIAMSDRGYQNINLMDSWSRTYQVLPNRTHPLMSMDSCSGFLLHAFKIDQ